MASNSQSDEDESWYVNLNISQKRSRRILRFDDSDEEGEVPTESLKRPRIDEKEKVDYDSDESTATVIVKKEDESGDRKGSRQGGQKDKSAEGNLKGIRTPVAAVDDDDDSSDVELLSVGSAGDDDKEIVDVDSDETFFEPPPPKASTSRSKRDQNRPGTSKRSYSDSDEDEEVSVSSKANKPLVSDDEEEDERDPSFKPNPSSSDTDFSDDELGDFKKSSKNKKPLRQANRNNIATDQFNSSDDEDDDYPIPAPKSYFPQQQENNSWLNMDDLELNTPPMYNPASARSEDWHGDVQRTVTMLDKTIEGMPMPCDENNEDIKLPPGLVELYSHQTYALRWMSWREGQFPGGGILADEMGLGKTIEVIALIMKSKWEAKKAGNENLISTEEAKKLIPAKTTLVVCPLGCIPQWEREIGTKGHNLTVHKYHGPKKITSAVELSKFDVILTTYQTIASEIPKLVLDPTVKQPRCRSPLKRIYWTRIVLDEAHTIRNPKTNAAQAIFQLEARYRWGVTGTPIHNRPEDFFSMCTFLRLTPFDDRLVWDFWIGLKSVKRGAEKRLHILGKALILRRTKDEVGLNKDGKVKPIPPKTVEVVNVQLSQEERQVYDMLMDYARTVLQKFLSQKEQREHGLQIGGLMYAAERVQERREQLPDDIKFSHIFALLIRLRQCAVLPHLITTMLQEEEIGDEENFNELNPEHIISKRNPVFGRMFPSSKFQKILEDIDELRDKAGKESKPMDKVIVVSSWTSTLDVIHEHLLAKNYTCVFITGRDDMNLRMDNMDRFNRNVWRPQILLLSLMAGGVGLNLVGANHVYFIEPHWNPQHELQAQDRVHRFGQTKDVTIRRYIAEDTIESRIMELQQQKRELADGLLSNTKKKRGAGITLEQMKHLFDLNRKNDIYDDDY